MALGVDFESQKEVLGLWIAENEGVKFWIGVLNELKNRGVKDILRALHGRAERFSRGGEGGIP
jgi:transposase-like protein